MLFIVKDGAGRHLRQKPPDKRRPSARRTSCPGAGKGQNGPLCRDARTRYSPPRGLLSGTR